MCADSNNVTGLNGKIKTTCELKEFVIVSAKSMDFGGPILFWWILSKKYCTLQECIHMYVYWMDEYGYIFKICRKWRMYVALTMANWQKLVTVLPRREYLIFWDHNWTDIFQNIENSFLRNYLAVFMGCVTLNLV